MANEDAITAEFEVAVDANSVQDMNDLASAADNIRTQMEAAMRSISDFKGYLQETGNDSRESVRSASVAERLPSRSEVESTTEELRRRDPERYENLLAERSRTLTDRAATVTDLAQTIFGETRAGGSFESMISTAAEGLGSLGSKFGNVGAESGALGRMAPMLLRGAGIAGGAAAVGLAGNQIIQAGGQQMQQYANMGSVRGGGMTDGLGYEMQVRSMAMNPFLSTEQSKQIVMTALSEGYTGKEFDTVTEFMSDNLKKMNMDVATSAKLLQTNVAEGGQAISELSNDLSTLKEITKGGVASLEENQQAYQQQTSAMISNNIDASAASDMALTSSNLWKDDLVLNNSFGQITSTASNQLIRQAGREMGVTGRSVTQTRGILGDTGQLDEGVYAVLHKEAHRLAGRVQDPYRLQELWNNRLRAYGIQMDLQQSSALLNKLLEDTDGTALKKSDEEIEEIEFGVEERSKSDRLKEVGKEALNIGAFVGNAVLDTVSMLDFGWGEDESLLTNFTEAYKDTGDSGQAVMNAGTRQRRYKVKALDDLYSQHGANNVKVVDKDGKLVRDFGTSRESVEKLNSGEYLVSVNDGTPTALRDAKALNSLSMLSGGAGGANSFTEVKISATDELRRLLDVKSKTSNQSRADMGYGGATRNNPPPEER